MQALLKRVLPDGSGMRPVQLPLFEAAWPARTGASVMAVLASAVLLVAAFPSPDFGVLGFVALVPLLLACRTLGAARSALAGFGFGVLTSFGIYRWLLEVPGIGAPQMAVLAAYVSLYPAAWCALLPRLQRSRVPPWLSVPAAWVLVEAARGHAGFLALPWATLAHTQHDNLALLQLASVTGEAGVSFAVVMVNVSVAEFIATRRGRPLATVGAAIVLLHAGGAAALATAPRGSTLTVAAIQPAIPVDARSTAEQRAAIWQRLEALTLEAAQARPAVIVWPETAVPDPLLADELAQRLVALAQRAGATLVVGAAQVEKFSTRTPDGSLAMRTRETHNAAHLVLPTTAARVEPYRKRRLVPFAEYLPLQGSVAWPVWLVRPMHAPLQAGPDKPPRWSLPVGTRIAALICWENLFAGLARDAVGNGAQVLVQLTNDAWFGRSAAAHQHNLASVLRAVENRVAVVIASNAGPSQIVDGRGRVLAGALGPFQAGVVVASVATAEGLTFYARAGDWLPITSALLLLAATVLPRNRQRFNERSQS
jgi:apolipoprotein N-acyltransferase